MKGLCSLGGPSAYFADTFGIVGAGPGITFTSQNPFASELREPDRRIDYIFVRGPDARGRESLCQHRFASIARWAGSSLAITTVSALPCAPRCNSHVALARWSRTANFHSRRSSQLAAQKTARPPRSHKRGTTSSLRPATISSRQATRSNSSQATRRLPATRLPATAGVSAAAATRVSERPRSADRAGSRASPAPAPPPVAQPAPPHRPAPRRPLPLRSAASTQAVRLLRNTCGNDRRPSSQNSISALPDISKRK